MTYVGAPYNYSSLSETTIERKKGSVPALNKFGKNLNSGEIYYTMTAKTDIIIGDHTGSKFYKNIDGKEAVKASSVRGLIRSNMQILSLSSIYDDISGNYSMMYREVGSAASELKKYYDDILGVGIYKTDGGGTASVRKNVKSGFLLHGKDGYYIYPSIAPLDKKTKGEQNYYVLRENQIILSLQNPNEKHKFKYLVEKGMNCLMYDYRGNYPFRKRGDVDRKAFDTHYRPSSKEIEFHIGMNGRIDEIAAPGSKSGAGWHHGYFVSSGYMNKKKAHYIVEGEKNPVDNQTGVIKVSDESIRAYEADYESRKNLFGTTQSMFGLSFEEKEEVKKASRDFYKLPAKGSFKPVFYIEKNVNEHMYFGFTPNLRLYYNHTIEEGVPESHKKTVNDYAKTILGFSHGTNNNKGHDAKSLKGRVSFSDAVINGKAESGKPQNLNMGGPKPTSYYDYLEQEQNRVVTYNDEGIRIRGYKQYWLHEKAQEAAEGNVKNAKFSSAFVPVKAGAEFKGVIRFNNLTDDELGLLLWSLRLEENSEQNIGKAKAYGYGRVKINIDDLRLFDLGKLYNFESLDFNPFSDMESNKVDELIQIYKKEASKLLGSDIMLSRSIAEFLLMKDASSFVPESDIRYMDLSTDYRGRQNEKNIAKRGLPHPDQVKKQNQIPLYLKPAFTMKVQKNETKAASLASGKNQNSGNSGAATKPVNRNNAFSAARNTPAQPQKPTVQALGVGVVVEGIVNGYLVKGQDKHGVFLSLPGMKKGLLHANNSAKAPGEYEARSKVRVKIIEYENGGKKIALSDKDLD